MSLRKNVPEILAVLEEESKKRPKMRFGQLFENLLAAGGQSVDPGKRLAADCQVTCIYYLEDEELLDTLEQGVKELS